MYIVLSHFTLWGGNLWKTCGTYCWSHAMKGLVFSEAWDRSLSLSCVLWDLQTKWYQSLQTEKERERELRRDKISSLSSCSPFYYYHHHHTTTLSKSSRRSFTNTGGPSSPEAAVGLCTCSLSSVHPILAEYVNIICIYPLDNKTFYRGNWTLFFVIVVDKWTLIKH